MRDICVNYTTAAAARSRNHGCWRREEAVATARSHACSQLAAVVVAAAPAAAVVVVVGVACVLWRMRSTC